jgi:C-terminal processing protease CtpA/Prc
MRSACVDQQRKAGFIEFQDAGTLRVHVDLQENGFYVKETHMEGLLVGDFIKKIDEQQPTSYDELKRMVFGKSGEKLTITLLRSGEEVVETIARVPFNRKPSK